MHLKGQDPHRTRLLVPTTRPTRPASRIGSRAQQAGGKTVQAGVDPDTERQRQRRCDGEAWRLKQPVDSVREIPANTIEPRAASAAVARSLTKWGFRSE